MRGIHTSCPPSTACLQSPTERYSSSFRETQICVPSAESQMYFGRRRDVFCITLLSYITVRYLPWLPLANTSQRLRVWLRWCGHCLFRLQLGLDWRTVPAAVLEALQRTLTELFRAVANLQALYIRNNNPESPLCTYLEREMFEGCTFHISKFNNEPDIWAAQRDYFRFLAQQLCKISDWISQSPKGTTNVENRGLLPILQVQTWAELLALESRPIRRLYLTGYSIPQLSQIHSLLHPFEQTLTHKA
jgi:hypothetical protein